jgi:hypothetical protein
LIINPERRISLRTGDINLKHHIFGIEIRFKKEDTEVLWQISAKARTFSYQNGRFQEINYMGCWCWRFGSKSPEIKTLKRVKTHKMVSRKTQEKGQNFLDPTKQNLRSYKRKLERLKTKGRERRGGRGC